MHRKVSKEIRTNSSETIFFNEHVTHKPLSNFDGTTFKSKSTTDDQNEWRMKKVDLKITFHRDMMAIKLNSINLNY